MKFTFKEALKGSYRLHFLSAVAWESPQVLQRLRSLGPKYLELTESFYELSEDHDFQFENSVIDLVEEGTIDPDFSNPFDTSVVLFKLVGNERYLDVAVEDLTDLEVTLAQNFMDLYRMFRKILKAFTLDVPWIRCDFIELVRLIAISSPNRKIYLWSATHTEFRNPSAVKFEFVVEGWEIGTDSKEFISKTSKDFQRFLRAYMRWCTKEYARRDYKQKSKNRDFTGLKWLVRWNSLPFQHLWEVLPHLEDFKKVDVNNIRQSKAAVNRISKAFALFEKFDLPVRPWEKKSHQVEKTVA